MKNNKSEKMNFAKIMWALAEDFGGKISNDSLNLRFSALKEYSIEQISQAGTWLLKHREQTFPAVPTTKEIITVIESQAGKIDIKTEAQKQCDVILKYLNYYGSSCDHVFKNPTTKYLMENRWSFHKLGQMKDDDLKWFRKEFCEAFESMKKSDNALSFVGNSVGQIDKAMISAENLKKLLK